VYLFVVRSGDMDWSVMGQVKEGHTPADWAKLISVLYWNFSGFDAVSTCAGEVRNPGKNFIRGLLSALLLVTLTYVLPLSTLASINEPDWVTWQEGSFSKIAQIQVGQWMAVWIVLSSFASNTGMYTAEVFEDSWQLCGMARTGLMPRVLGNRWNGDTGPPHTALALALVVIIILVGFDFEEIVYITNLFNCLSAMLELLSFLKLRLVEPDLERPFRVPVTSISAVSLFLLPPLIFGGFVCCSSLLCSRWSVILNSIVLVVGLLLYKCMHSRGQIQYSRQMFS